MESATLDLTVSPYRAGHEMGAARAPKSAGTAAVTLDSNGWSRDAFLSKKRTFTRRRVVACISETGLKTPGRERPGQPARVRAVSPEPSD